MRCVEIRAAGWTGGARDSRAAGPGPGSRRGAHRRGGGGRQPARRAATAWRLPAAAGGQRPPGPRGQRHGARGGRRACRGRASARPSARWYRGAAMPPGVSPPPSCACRSPKASTSCRRRGCRKPVSPSGPTSSTAGALRPVRRRCFTAGRAVSARPPSRWPRRAARGRLSRPAPMRSARRASSWAPLRPSTTAIDDFVDEVRRLTGGRGVDLDPGHRGRVLRAAKPGRAGHGRPPGADRPDGGGARGAGGFPQGAGPPPDHHRVHAAPAQRGREGASSPGRFWLRSGRSCPTARVRPVVHRTFPLAEAAAAHRLMETSDHIGKILLTTR